MKALFLAFFVVCLYDAQIIQRFSDSQDFESIIVKTNGQNSNLTKSNFKSFKFKEDDQILYENRLLDFAVTHDTLVFFDKVKEIESVDLKVEKKTEQTFKTKKRKNTIGSIYANSFWATLIQVPIENENSFVKSITIYPTKQFYFEGKLKIILLNIKNGLPDDSSPIVSFEKNLTEIKVREWEIVLPKIIRYPKDGFAIVFLYENKKLSLEESRFLNHKCTNESTGFVRSDYTKKWSVRNSFFLQYKLKILQ
jgi:hypothetical protein